MVAEGTAALVREVNLYQRSGELVTITREPERAETSGNYVEDIRRGADITLQPGTPRMRRVSLPALRIRLANVAAWEKYKEGTQKREGMWVPANPDAATAAAVLDPTASGGWPSIRPLRGIVEAPLMRPDGSIVERAGYDPETGYTLLPSCEFPAVPEHPTQADAQAALRHLWIEMFCDFPFKGLGESDPSGDPDRVDRFERARSVPDAFVGVTALLTELARAAILGAVPGYVFEAASQGSGKTMQVNAVATVATGRAAGVMTFPSSRGEPNEEELEKVIASYTIAGVPIIAFDNVKGLLGGAALEKVLTAESTVSLRVLGESTLRELPWTAIVMCSGNNMTMTDDVSQRVLVSRLESEREDPRKRPATDFRHKDLLPALRELRPSLLCDALTVLRAFMVATDAQKETARREAGAIGSYYAWSALIPPALKFAGGPRIVDARPDIGDMGQDSESEAHATLMNGWLWGDVPVKSADIIRRLFEHEHEIRTGQVQPDGYDDLRAAIRTLCKTGDNAVPNPNALGLRMRGLRGKWRDGSKIEAESDRHTKAMMWRRISRRSLVTVVPMAETPAAPDMAPPDDFDPAEEFDR